MRFVSAQESLCVTKFISGHRLSDDCGVVVWVRVRSDQTAAGRALYRGWAGGDRTVDRMLTLNSRRLDLFIVTVIVLLAAFFRLYRLDQLPPGLHYDEAFNATMAQRVLSGVERPIYFTEDLTEEPMAIYLTALSFGLFGVSPWSIRLVSALAGIATVVAIYFLARALFQSRGTAALAAFVLAILYWHVNFSRLGMEPIFVPLTMTLAFEFLWHALRPNPLTPFPYRAGGWGIGGIFLAATQYTYKAALFVPILFVAFIGTEILIDRKFWTRHRRGLFICVAIAILVFAPLGLYLATHPAQFFERPSTVTATTTVTTIIDHTIKVAGMFFVQGDENPRSNLPGRPALDPFLAIGFIVGIAVCIVRIRKTESRFLLLWLVVMSLPSVLTDFAPHFGRNIGATPAIALIIAYGFSFIITQTHYRLLLTTVYCLLLTGFVFSTFSTFSDYFNVWGSRTGLFDSFDVGQLTLAQKLRARPADESLYLSPVDAHHYTIQFGLAGRAVASFDGRHALVIPASAATYGIITRDDPQSITRLQSIFERGRVVETVNDGTGKPYASIYRVEGASHVTPQKIVDARLGDEIDLLGYDIAQTNQSIDLNVYWRSRAATREDYTVFVQLLGVAEPVAQIDTQPGRGSYLTSRWRPGEIVIDHYRLSIPNQLPRGEYALIIGMYNLTTGARVRTFDANGAPMESDRVIFERITLP